jgi:hypothetical protein
MSLKRWDGSQWVTVAGSRPGPTGPAGPQGPVGPQGPAGPAGSAGPAGPQGPQGVAGPAGPQGSQGPQGIQGQRGTTYTTGSVAPSSTVGFITGDQFLNTTTGDLYVFSSTPTPTWTLSNNIKGPAGPQGPAGPTGPTGEVVVADIERRVSAYELDILLNLGIYFPKYNTLANLSQVTGTLSAQQIIF